MPRLSPISSKVEEPSVSTTPESSLTAEQPFLTRSSDYVSEGDTSETTNVKCLNVTRKKVQPAGNVSRVKGIEFSSKRLKISHHLAPMKISNDAPQKKFCRKKKQLAELCNRKTEEITDTTSESSTSIRKEKFSRRKLKERILNNDIKSRGSSSRSTMSDKNCDGGRPKAARSGKSPVIDLKRKRGRKPKRTFPNDTSLNTRQELEALEEEGLNLELICFNITDEDMKIDKVVPMFDEKYRTRGVNHFLELPSQKPVNVNERSPSLLSKVASKETLVPAATSSSVQTMLKVITYFKE